MTVKSISSGFMHTLIASLCAFLPLSAVAFSATSSGVGLFSASGGTVNVVVERHLEVGPAKARDAWLSYQFRGGADLPGVLVFPRGDSDDRRLIFPVMMEEAILGTASTGDGTEEIGYKVTDLGLLQSELKEGSHSAIVRFSPGAGDHDLSIMTWEVTFEATKHRAFWESVTKQNVQLASDNLASYTATPKLLTRRTLLKAESVATAVDAWVEFIWKSGGGLPCLPPINVGENDRFYVPPLLQERIVSVDTDSGEIKYQVVNPGLFTYPVHTHAGRVRFLQIGEKEVEMIWSVEVQPLRGFEGFVKTFTSAVVSTLARNLKVHLAEPGAVVPISPPRGKGEPFAKVRKDSWVGGVLSAHLSDRRPVMEQTIDMVQPWTWGRNEDDDGEGEGWSVGSLPP